VENLVLYNVLFSSQILNGLSGDLKKMPGYQALFHVEPTYQASTTKSQKIIMLPPTQLPAIISIVDTIMEECRNDAVDKGGWTMAFSKLLQLLVTIFRICASTPVRTTDQSTIMRLAKVFSFIESNLGHPVPNEELSSVAAMSIATLNRYFKKTTGYSPVQYHIRKRIEYSCKLLLNTDLNIMEIAEKAGFSDSNYFARTFRKVMGASPSAFKKTNRLS
jgi:AraC family L-rhamnose operon transcriptional activator RhaR/AraC family L-rhamnose operon regulatory protein RhaS